MEALLPLDGGDAGVGGPEHPVQRAAGEPQRDQHEVSQKVVVVTFARRLFLSGRYLGRRLAALQR